MSEVNAQYSADRKPAFHKLIIFFVYPFGFAVRFSARSIRLQSKLELVGAVKEIQRTREGALYLSSLAIFHVTTGSRPMSH